METKQSTVKRVLHNTRSYDTKYGTMFVHVITMENGDSGDYSAKTDTCTKFKENEPCFYTIEFGEYQGQRTSKIRPVEPPQGQQGVSAPFRKGGSGSDESFALSYSKDLACSKIETGDKHITAETIIADAEKFYGWLKSKKQ